MERVREGERESAEEERWMGWCEVLIYCLFPTHFAYLIVDVGVDVML